MALSINDLSILFKRKVYEIENNAKGKKLVWDSEKNEYVAHFDSSNSDNAPTKDEQLKQWAKYGSGNGWGNNGW